MRSLLALPFLFGPATALACSLPGNLPWLADPAEVEADHTPPGEVSLTVAGLHRGVGPQRSGPGCGEMATSCDDLGWVALRYEAQDDRTSRDRIAVEIELVSGELPGDLFLPAEPAYLENLVWIDDATDEQEPVDFRIRARAVDLAGNRGPWSEPVRVRNEGSSGGCSASAGNGSLVALAVLALAARRRRSIC